MPELEYITVAKAAELSGLTPRHIQRLLKRGVIEGVRPGHEWLVRPSAVMAYLRQERKPGPKPKRRHEDH